MLACGKEDMDLREKNTDGDEGSKTLECLRGRLQAERQASRSAKRDAELMSNKLVELEKLLKQELRLKKRAEKKLILLKKKLQSMKGSSTNSTNQEEEEEQSKSQIINPEILDKISDNASESSSSNSKSTETPSSSQSYEDPKINRDSFSSSSMASKSEIEMDGGDFVDDTWALVPVSWPAAVEPRVVSGSVDEVLDVLRRAREGLKCSMERRRNIIRVGPACN